MNRILQIRKGGDVKRFHTVTMHREHLVASHSWGVATLILHIYPTASRDLIVAALYHDVPEYATGDMPATTKWANPALAVALSQVEDQVVDILGLRVDLCDEEAYVLKFADMADLVLACIQEHRMGNREAHQIVNRGLDYLTNYVVKHPIDNGCVEFLTALTAYASEAV